jgi:CheY-like chemotaxis protein
MDIVKIFISHNHADNDFCEALVSALRTAGADVWYDEHNMGAGVLLKEINQQLLDRKIFLVILSKASLSSNWVRSECEWAYTLYMQDPSRVVLPILVEHLDQQDFNSIIFLSSFKRIEAAGSQPYSPQQAIQKTLQALVLGSAFEMPLPVKMTREPHILWVDDNPSNNVYERRYLEKLGIEFTISISTDDAIGKMVRNHYDLIISDMGRPADPKAGYTLLEELQRLSFNIPFIIYAGSNAPEHVAEAKRQGAIGSAGDPTTLFTLVREALKI